MSTAVLLVNLGTPAAPTPFQVALFLRSFLSDPRVVNLPKFLWNILLHFVILPLRSFRVAKLYQKIWMKQGSPLKVYMDKLQISLEQQLLNHYQKKIPVYTAMTYGKSQISTILKNIQDNDPCERLIVLPLFPQYTQATTGAVWDALSAYFKKQIFIPSIHFIHAYSDHDLYIQALYESIMRHWEENGRAEKLLFSFHGIPLTYELKGDPYPKQCLTLAHELAKKLNISRDFYEISFQSRFGFQAWTSPFTEAVLVNWARQGVQSVAVIAPSFAVDCLETLEELNIQMRQSFIHAGGKRYHYIPALNDNLTHITLLKQLIEKFF